MSTGELDVRGFDAEVVIRVAHATDSTVGMTRPVRDARPAGEGWLGRLQTDGRSRGAVRIAQPSRPTIAPLSVSAAVELRITNVNIWFGLL